MTSKQLYEGVLIEMNKENASNILLEDFNYLANKSINQYVNKRYNIYDVNQQTTDDLRVLKATAILIPHKCNDYEGLTTVDGNMATYYVDLPDDYLHLLNCIVIYNVKKTYKCYNAGDTWRAAATRLTADAYSQVLDNFWLKPTYKRPYYYIHNVNRQEALPTNLYRDRGINYTWDENNQYIDESGLTKDLNGNIINGTKVIYTKGDNDILKTIEEYESGNIVKTSHSVSNDNVKEGTDIPVERTGWVGGELRSDNTLIVKSGTNPRSLVIGGLNASTIERSQGLRYGNVSKVRMEIRYGTDNSIFTLDHEEGKKGGKIYIDYIKTPQHIRLTQKELDTTEDISQVLEFPDYVCQEILNELVHIIMENISDQRLQTHPVVSQSIANPAQAQAPQAAQGQAAQ